MNETYVNGEGRQPVVETPTAAVMSDQLGTQHQKQNSTHLVFRKALRRDLKLRLGISGPGGSGKTYTLLKLATLLGGPVAAIDTEHGSMSKYADLFEFDVCELASFDPDLIPVAIKAVADAGYQSLVIDSLSHFWNGVDGELDQVDRITLRSRSSNSWAAWREVSPKHNRMLDAMLSAPIHILVGMRVKTEWIVEQINGKSVPRKVGLQPVMRDGIEYEFDITADMDQENNFIISKTRCPALTGKVFNKPGQDVADVLKVWLGSSQTAEQIQERKPPQPQQRKPWKNREEALSVYFPKLREALGEVTYGQALEKYAVEDPAQFTSMRKAVEFYNYLLDLQTEAA